MPLLILIFLIPFAYSDALLDAIFGRYPAYQSTPTTTTYPISENSYSDDSEPYFDAYGDQTEHYSWDNIYLCQFCDTEIIIDPYGPNEAEQDYDY